MPVRRAAIDVGTNSVRLLVADVTRCGGAPPRVRPVDRALEITRLGEGLDEGGMIRPAPAERTAAAVNAYIGRAAAHGVDVPVVVGTYALRAARNPEILLDRIGVPVRVIGGEEEAALGFRGAVAGLPGLDPAAPVVVLDVGGGSIELTWGNGRGDVEDSRSLPLGCVVMTRRMLAHDPPDPGEVAALEGALADALDPVLRPLRAGRSGAARGLRRGQPCHYSRRQAPRLIGVGGTVTTLAAMTQRLVPYDPDRVHEFDVTAADVDRLLAAMRAVPLTERRQLPGLQPERADVIIAGALVVRHVLASFGRDVITASEADLLWALVAAP